MEVCHFNFLFKKVFFFQNYGIFPKKNYRQLILNFILFSANPFFKFLKISCAISIISEHIVAKRYHKIKLLRQPECLTLHNNNFA